MSSSAARPGSPKVTQVCACRAAVSMARGPPPAIANGTRGRWTQPGHGSGIDGLVPAAVEPVDRRLGEEPVEVIDELGEAPGALGRRPGLLPEGLGVPPGAAGTDAQREPAVREVVEGHDLLGQRHGMAEVRGGDQRAQPHGGRRTGRRREERDGREPGPVPQVPPGQVVVGPGGVGAERLGALPDGLRLAPGHRGQDHDSDAHRPDRRGRISTAIVPRVRCVPTIGG